MISVLTGEQMKACDRYAIENRGIPSRVLMERAAAAATEVLETEGFDLSDVLVAVGSGNNGGDGLAMARMMKESGYPVRVLLAGAVLGNGQPDLSHASEGFREQFALLPNTVKILSEFPDGQPPRTVVDAIFGIGVSRPVVGRSAELIEKINTSGARVLSVDLPSGIHSDTGAVMGIAVRASVTVTIDRFKTGLWLYPGKKYAGKILCRDIGIGTDGLGANGTAPCPAGVLTENDLPLLLPVRPARSHKGTFGRVLVVAGSRAMAGAAYFAAKAAYRTGAGLVEILTPECNRVILQTLIPEAVLTVYDETAPDIPKIRETVSRADAAVIGPGLGTSDCSLTVLRAALGAVDAPTVLDADGLNLLAAHPEIIGTVHAPLILTPHPAEAARLTGIPVPELLCNLPGSARMIAERFGAVCVFKDAATVTAAPNGDLMINQSGNSGMATGGSGDVLSGILGGLLAVCRHDPALPLGQTAALGVYLHGLAGDAAAEKLGEASVMASDIADGIAEVFRSVQRPEKR